MNKQNVNCVFIGHIDAGKSSLCGNLLYLTGQISTREVNELKSKATSLNRESWSFAFAMDINEEEQAKGKTVDVGRDYFKTQNRRYTILDAPGHKNYVPNMISGVTQADIGVLVVSARKGEFEAGFTRQGQTREHVLLAKSLGVERLIVVINKMDDKSVNWSEERYNYIVENLRPFICKLCGYRTKKGTVVFLPISGLKGTNIMEKIPKSECSWYNEGVTLMEVFDSISLPDRHDERTLILPIIRKDNAHIYGKIEQGSINIGDKIIVKPAMLEATVKDIQVETVDENIQVDIVKTGENVKIKLDKKTTDIYKGFVLGNIGNAFASTNTFIGQLTILPPSDNKIIIGAGYESILHIHTFIDECKIEKLYEFVNGKITKKTLQFATNSMTVGIKVTTKHKVCLDKYINSPHLGQFILRSNNTTLGIGRVLLLPKK